MKDERLTGEIINAAMRVHAVLGAGFNEKVYQMSLLHELKKRKIVSSYETMIRVFYDEVCVGKFYADILVAEKVILEIKALQELLPCNFRQVKNYLKATGLETGLLLNFGASSLQYHRIFHPVKAGVLPPGAG